MPKKKIIQTRMEDNLPSSLAGKATAIATRAKNATANLNILTKYCCTLTDVLKQNSNKKKSLVLLKEKSASELLMPGKMTDQPYICWTDR